MVSIHSILCKWTGETIAMKLGGGWCVCSRAKDCPFKFSSSLEDFLTRIKAHAQWSPVDKQEQVRFMALALCGEVGELANLVKKDWRGDSGDRRDQIKEELAFLARQDQ